MNILLAIRQANVRLALELLLSEEPGICIVGMASETEGLLALIHTASPDLVVADWSLLSRPATHVLAEACTMTRQVRFLVLGHDSGMRQQALDAGAHAFVLVGDPPEQLLAALRQVRTSSSR